MVVPDPAPGTAVFDCDVIWQDQNLDLALLRVRDDCHERWKLAMAQAKKTVLAEPGPDAVPAQAVGYPDLALDGTQPAPELVPGSLEPARAALGGRMPFDVNSSVPEDSASWQGMSGAAVRDEHGRLLGVVVQVDKQHQQRRFYAAVLPAPAGDPGFREALAAVGAPPVLEASDAPANRALLAVLDPAGRPYAAAEAPDLAALGIRRSRTDVETHGDPYYPYVRRDLDQILRDALDRRARETERRALLLVGDAMTGKSRTLMESLRRHPVLAGWPLLVPQRNADLRIVVERAAGRGGVVWLDNASTYTTGLDSAVRALADTPGVMVAATLRTDQFLRLQENPDLRATWDVLSASWLVEQFTVESEWTESERAGLAGSEPVIREAVRQGRPLGQVLGAAVELSNRLHLGSVWQKALVFTVSDWPRTGMPAAISENLAESLWSAHLSPSKAADLADMADEDRAQTFSEVRAWACQKIAGAPALVRRTRNGLVAEDYIVGLRVTAKATVPAVIWQQALSTAQSAGSQDELSAIGYQAAMSRSYDIAQQAMSPIAHSDSQLAPTAANALGNILIQQGKFAEAAAAFQRAIESGDPDVAPRAANSLGNLLQKHGMLTEAVAAYRLAIASGHPEIAPRALISLGDLLAKQGDMAGARAAYQDVIDSGIPDAVPSAEQSTGDLLKKQGDMAAAKAAYQRAIDSGHPRLAPMALISLGRLLAGQSDVAGAKTAYQGVIDAGDPDAAAIVLLDLGDLLRDNGDVAGARTAYQQAIDSGHPVAQPRGYASLGRLLAGHGDMASAKAAYQQAIDCGDADVSPQSTNSLADLLAAQGDLAGAIAAYRQAMASGHPDYAPAAALGLGKLLGAQGDVAGAADAYQRVIASGNPDAGAAAAFGLALLLDQSGQVAAAKAAYQQAIAFHSTKFPDIAPGAMSNMAAMLAKQDDAAGATAAYQQAIDTGHPEWAPAAAFGLATLLTEHGDTGRAKALYQFAIDTAHRTWAPMALVKLGEMLAGEGDAVGATAAFQQAIASGSRDHAPIAMVELGQLLAGLGDVPGATAAYQQAIDTGHHEQAPRAMISLGLLLAGQGDMPGATAAYQQAADSGNPTWAVGADIGMGDMLAEHGDLDGARSAYARAIKSGHADLAPMATVQFGRLLAGHGDVPGATAAYQQAIESGHPVQGPAAMISLGYLLATNQGAPDPQAARRWYQRAADVGSTDAMLGLAAVLAAEGDSAGAHALLQQAERAGNLRAGEYAAALGDDPVAREDARARISDLANGGDTDALNFLGVLAWRGGSHDEALALWRRSRDAHDGAAPLLLHDCAH